MATPLTSPSVAVGVKDAGEMMFRCVNAWVRGWDAACFGSLLRYAMLCQLHRNLMARLYGACVLAYVPVYLVPACLLLPSLPPSSPPSVPFLSPIASPSACVSGCLYTCVPLCVHTCVRSNLRYLPTYVYAYVPAYLPTYIHPRVQFEPL